MLNEIVIERAQIANLTRSTLSFLENKDTEVSFYKKSADMWEKEYLSKYLTETVEYFGNIFKAQAEEKFNKKNMVLLENLEELKNKEKTILKKLASNMPVAFNTEEYFVGMYKSGDKYVFGSTNITLEAILFEDGQEYNLWIAICYNYANKVIKDRDLRFVVVDYLVGRQISNVFKLEYKNYLEEGLSFLKKRKRKLKSKKLIRENEKKELIYKTLIENPMQREKIVSFSEKIFYNVFIYYKKVLKAFISGMFEIRDRYYDETYDRLLFYKLEEREKLVNGILKGIEDQEERYYRRMFKSKARSMKRHRKKLMEKYKISQPTEGDITDLLKKSGFLEKG
ncbi:MAG: hypothetical protein U9N35_01540 [Euryarchaeota archaeon]|nr:hypothetical protein [Euryarchaeota archaeon]